jgi:hypothetical protein
MAQLSKIQNIPNIPKMIPYNVYGTVRNILAGAGLCYAVQNKKYEEIPLTLFVPSVYAGYHIYKNKEAVVGWMKEQKKE